ncbi:hypothetical protein QKW52_02665 [Bacillus sonorensis]|nr:hypothetical protein [Bacillus sonorensis]
MGGKEDLLAVSDESGIFGSLSEHSNRRPVKTETKDALQLVFFRPSTPKDEASLAARSFDQNVRTNSRRRAYICDHSLKDPFKNLLF